VTARSGDRVSGAVEIHVHGFHRGGATGLSTALASGSHSSARRRPNDDSERRARISGQAARDKQYARTERYLDRVQESRGRLEVEIRKLLHEVSGIAEEALVRARKLKEEGEPAVEAELHRLDDLERKVSSLADSVQSASVQP
jgi:hypothetical protein